MCEREKSWRWGSQRAGHVPGDDDDGDIMFLAVTMEVLETSVEGDACRRSEQGQIGDTYVRYRACVLTLLQLLLAKIEGMALSGDAF